MHFPKRIFGCAGVMAVLLSFLPGAAEQISINRVERMPNQPQPFLMRDWKQVTAGYDSLVFDLGRTGQYLPLVWIDNNSANYPGQPRFGLHTVVGTPHTRSAEAINVLPAVISASLVGIDKSNQNGFNWVQMCEDFFNNRPEEMVYLNNFTTSSGNDWWYDTMPNIFFYQLADLYPGSGHFDEQFISVADRWLEAVQNMGGREAPWQKAYMNYRAWKLSNMTPLATGVKQPEGAGTIAWLLYQAYTRTNNPEYRKGAEWAMEFLNEWSSNPAYELQLPYGVYAAARMNAELGTGYDIEKLLTWCFSPDDNVRDWGATLGNWGGYDCDGLIGEAKYAGYAFFMNGVEQAGALVPMVRYDDRFARIIGKWVLNLANASRLFYPNYLPDDHQDSEAWAHTFDPHSYIAHESMRQYALNTAISPYATGDAIRGNWGETNLALYGASHAGILGGIIDTTDVPKILRLDCRKTDYFQENAFPTYLYFNPYSGDKSITVDAGMTPVDLYDAVTNQFIGNTISGSTSISIPANGTVLLVLVPAGGTRDYIKNQLLVNGIVVDYNTESNANLPPRIKGLAANPDSAMIGESVTVYCTAEDPSGSAINYFWQTDGGSIIGTSSPVTWTAPESAGNFEISCIVINNVGLTDTAVTFIRTISNRAPQINKIEATPVEIQPSATVTLFCDATDPDGNELSYQWSVPAGVINGDGAAATWVTPAETGFSFVLCRVSDQFGGTDIDSLGLMVGNRVAAYSFSGNAEDESGLENHGSVFGAQLAADKQGQPEMAYWFDGADDFILVPNQPALNFTGAISVAACFRADELFNREMFLISHGSWENRWKISLTPDTHRIRWTLKTSHAIRDVDSQNSVQTGQFYHVVGCYDGTALSLYINGQFSSSTPLTGPINTTSFDLTIGQILPANSNYNFKGLVDDIQIYNRQLDATEIQKLFEQSTPINQGTTSDKPSQFGLAPCYPNPFNGTAIFQYQLVSSGEVQLRILDVLGRTVNTLVQQHQQPGTYEVQWHGRNQQAQAVAGGIYFAELKQKKQVKCRKLLYLK